jgi:hypothetical protein
VAWRVGRGFAGLVLAGVSFTFVRDGGTSTMDEVPWLLVLLVALMISVALSGISLFRAPSHAAVFVFLTSAIFSTPLVLLWALVTLNPD